MNKIASKKIKRKIIIFFSVFTIIAIFADFQFRPIIKNISSNQARIITSQTVNDSVHKDMEMHSQDYSSTVEFYKNPEGEILAISSNIEKINHIKTNISLLVQQRLCDLKNKNISIALGTLTGFEILNGKGPSIPLKISASGSVKTDLKSDFSSTGINQTLHKIYICIFTKINVILPGCSCITELDTTVLISETVVVGKVPNLYGGSGSTSGSNSGSASGNVIGSKPEEKENRT